MEQIRLTALTSGTGRASKMGPEPLAQVLRPLSGMFPAKEYPDLLVGLEVSDDAAVYRISDERAVILTLDFFAPVVDDPYDYGAITRRRPPVACSSPCQRSWGELTALFDREGQSYWVVGRVVDGKGVEVSG